jgi:hypothetical protein
MRRRAYVVEELRELGERLFDSLDVFMTFLDFTVGRSALAIPVRAHEL